jgi:hypothetical protein
MDPAGAPSFWDAVRAWADDMGLLVPPEDDPAPADDAPHRPKVPQAVCDSCPICQGAATFEQVNPEILTELADLARSVVTGLASAMASASDQRDRAGPDPDPEVPRAVDGRDDGPVGDDTDRDAHQDPDQPRGSASDDPPSDR